MIQEWQDDEGPYEQRHKKEIIELSTDASVVSKYTAYIAVDVAQNKPVSGSMQSYELTAYGKPSVVRSRRYRGGGVVMVMKCSAPMSTKSQGIKLKKSCAKSAYRHFTSAIKDHLLPVYIWMFQSSLYECLFQTTQLCMSVICKHGKRYLQRSNTIHHMQM